MDASARPGPSRRTDYRAFHNLTTRWADNDVFGHVNNAAYYGFFDTAVIAWLFTRGLVGFATGPMGVVAETSCRFIGEVTFPETLAVGMRLSHVGASSVRWELARFRETAEHASAEGYLVHVHVGRQDRRPAPMPPVIRTAMIAVQA
jgi:acyl-CoA thioester hydrolase